MADSRLQQARHDAEFAQNGKKHAPEGQQKICRHFGLAARALQHGNQHAKHDGGKRHDVEHATGHRSGEHFLRHGGESGRRTDQPDRGQSTEPERGQKPAGAQIDHR
ncbi:hypothetical protein GALL_502820 [mine drainage metagenome]|uniref:Uncharacterized protein n=1 Tax=mine drainage metagenome TaxID=410659 RepID=A0A1J5PJZ9_9ZZZZ